MSDWAHHRKLRTLPKTNANFGYCHDCNLKFVSLWGAQAVSCLACWQAAHLIRPLICETSCQFGFRRQKSSLYLRSGFKLSFSFSLKFIIISGPSDLDLRENFPWCTGCSSLFSCFHSWNIYWLIFHAIYICALILFSSISSSLLIQSH